MSDLNRLIAAERDAAPRPSKDEAKQCWDRIQRSAIVGALPPIDVPPPPALAAVGKAAAATTGLSSAAKVVLATTVGATTVVGGAEVVRRNVTAPPDPAPIVATADTRDAEPSPAPAPEPTVAVAPVAPPVAAPPPPVVQAPVDDGQTAEDPQPAAPDEKPRRPAKAAPAKRGIAAELDVLRRAQAAMAAGKAKRALRILDRHRRDFPDGRLAEDREALRVAALCTAGRAEAGKNAAAKFAKTWPGSMHLDRVAAACRTPDP